MRSRSGQELDEAHKSWMRKAYPGADTSASVWAWGDSRGWPVDYIGDGDHNSLGGEVCSLPLSNAGGSEVCYVIISLDLSGNCNVHTWSADGTRRWWRRNSVR